MDQKYFITLSEEEIQKFKTVAEEFVPWFKCFVKDFKYISDHHWLTGLVVMEVFESQEIAVEQIAKGVILTDDLIPAVQYKLAWNLEFKTADVIFQEIMANDGRQWRYDSRFTSMMNVILDRAIHRVVDQGDGVLKQKVDDFDTKFISGFSSTISDVFQRVRHILYMLGGQSGETEIENLIVELFNTVLKGGDSSDVYMVVATYTKLDVRLIEHTYNNIDTIN